MRIMAHGTGDSQMLRQGIVLFLVRRLDIPRLQHALSGVTANAPDAVVIHDVRHGLCVSGPRPLLREWVVVAGVAFHASVVQGLGDPDGRNRLVGIRVLHVGDPRTMAALALDVVVGDVLGGVPPRGVGERVPLFADGVAPVAEVLGMSGPFERLECIGVGRCLPVTLCPHVTVAAGGHAVGRIEVPEETT